MLGCGPKPSRQEVRTGINGEAVYTLNKDGSVKNMFKREYSVHEYSILLKNDTVNMGDDFSSMIIVTSPKNSIQITSPEEKVISTEGNDGVAKYSFHPPRPGIYNYGGIIQFDTVVARFEYRFVVVSDH